MTTNLSSRRRRAIAVSRRVPVGVEVAVALLARDPGLVIGYEPPPPWTDQEPRADVGVELPRGRQVVRAVRIGFGPIIEDEDGTRALPVWWEDAEHPELFPTFDGGIELHGDGNATELRLVGSYQPPLGTVGRFADSLVGHRVALASLDSFLAATGDRLTLVAAALL
ncbi:MAG TPA: hypothetical protein VFS16_05335 [Acidimicrobiia bacterium]|nr:hypothetical protein [Acidimicrobiia bacterium]